MSSLCKIYSLSVIIICRFHLSLLERRHHPNESSSSSSLPRSGFRPAAQRAHNAVVEKFGDSYMSLSLGTEASEVEETQQDSPITTEEEIELHEFPWAARYVGDVETAGRIASGTQWLALSDTNWHILQDQVYLEPPRLEKGTRHSPQLPMPVSAFKSDTTIGQKFNR